MWGVAQTNLPGHVSINNCLAGIRNFIRVFFFQHVMERLKKWQNSCHYVTYCLMSCHWQFTFAM